jgi:hypothetical protein
MGGKTKVEFIIRRDDFNSAIQGRILWEIRFGVKIEGGGRDVREI